MNIIKQRTSEYGFPYLAYVPDEISEHPALIIQLHGAGQRGDGGDGVDCVTVHGFANIVNDDNLKDAILIMPQCPEDSFWCARIESIKRFIDTMIEEYDADPSRIYLCGLSMGGFGTWYTAMAYPDMFAAIAPCCGGGMAWNAHTLLKTPIRAFHGREDRSVSVNHTLEMARALENRKHFDFQYTIYEGVGHNSWEQAFSPELLAWLLSKHK